ncbi:MULTISPECIES: YesL family protein [Bacillaceae]|uniref:YesL family protein n=1 Tax=Bacillaceae TaxID=186817 RepID=UPI001F2F2E95|nr:MULTISPECIES: YesL family protein [Bacillaceae]MCF2650559.1 YesL family protein [Niallia circulans]CAI9393756.1 hypothetical protein BACSP_03655 [Bacillus sp. T2.9-1]
MNDIFEWNGPIYRFLAKIVDLFVLNAVFLISCLPIVTMGSSITAMYSITMKMVRNEDVSIIKGFIDSFKKNFKQSTIIWMIVLAVGVILSLDYYFLNLYTGSLSLLVKLSLIIFTFAYLLLFTFIFPYVARFENSIKNSIINTWKIAFLHPIKTFTVLIFTTMIPVITFVFSIYSFLFLLYFCMFIGFSLIAYVNTIVIRSIYERYEN